MMLVKGAAVNILPKYVQKNFGKDALSQWMDSITPAAREVFDGTVSSKDWFPLKEALVEPTATLCQLFYGWDYKGAWELGRYSADQSLKGIFKLFVKFGSPEVLINRAGTAFSTYYHPSTIKVQVDQQGFPVMRIMEFEDIDKLVEMRIGGWIERALEISGCKNVEIKINQSLTKGDACTEYKITWDK
jgi:hypothetical protein